MRILLLNPCDDRSKFHVGSAVFGLLNIGTYLMTKGHEVRGIDLNHAAKNLNRPYLKSSAAIVEEIRQFNPDVCGITTFTYTRHNAYYWAKLVKGLNKNIKIVLGGVHASAEPLGVLENVPEVDFIVIGEGEITMEELCVAISRNGDLSNVKGIAFRNNGQLKVSPARQPIEDINILPKINRRLFLKENMIPKVKQLEIMAGRGCPSQCKFCSSGYFWKGHRRIRSAKNIIEELEEGVRLFPNLNFIRFWDETLLKDGPIAFEIMATLKKIGLPWECWSRVCDLDEDKIKKMKNSGCWRVRIGLETGSARLMRDLKKPVDLNKVTDLFRMFRKYKLKYSPSIIFGLPGSEVKDIYDTLKLLKNIKADPSSCTISMSTFLFPGTEYFEDFKKENSDFTWEGTRRKYKNTACIKDRYGNYLFPTVGLPKNMPNWKCHLLYIKSTFLNHPVNTSKRLFSLLGIFLWRILGRD